MRYPEGLSYACEKFGNAVEKLATGRADVRSRLREAFIEFSAVFEKDIPEELLEDFRWVKQQLTKRDPITGEGKVIATLERMQNRTGEKIAKRIVYLASKLEGYRDQQMIDV